MDWLGELAVTELGEVVRLEPVLGSSINIDQAGEIPLCVRLTAYSSAT